MSLEFLHRREEKQSHSARIRTREGPRRPSLRPHIEVLEGRLLLATYVVTSTNDAGSGSLRQAILDANGDTGTGTIAFNIAGSGVQTIKPMSALPTITHPVIIDGTTQPGFSSSPLIELNGVNAGANAPGLEITAGRTTVSGLVINRFNGSAIDLQTQGNNVIAGNFLGTNATGTGRGPGGGGITISNGSADNTIGGTAAGARNLIAGNLGTGLVIQTDGNQVEGNFIGIDVTGTAALANATGVFVRGSHNTIGGAAAAARNVISGNGSTGFDTGITITGTDNLIAGNYIGTNAAGTGKVGNYIGVYITGSNTVIGGTVPGAGNLISGNPQQGVWIATDYVQVLGNYIGTDVTGTVALANGEGIYSPSGSNITIGGSVPTARNLISGNASGVTLSSGTGNGCSVLGNHIGTDVTGTLALPNVVGVSVDMPFGVLGGTAPGAENLISGNLGDGVQLGGGTVEGNYIGTDVTGTKALPNMIGVHATRGGVVIGGSAAAARNLISGNTQAGIVLDHRSLIPGNVVEGNYIGTDRTGTMAVGNGTGLVISGIATGGTKDVIGGTTAGAGNLISGNLGDGLDVTSTNDGGNNQIVGNYIGTDATGLLGLPNHGDGISVVRSSGTVIGGTIAGARNVIAANTGVGIRLANFLSLGANQVDGNYIGTNALGTAPLPNAIGVLVDSVSNVQIGGTVAGAGNLISGNILDGIQITGVNPSSELIQGNFIGTDVTGTKALANGFAGISISGGTNNTVGGTPAGARNLIAGNGSYGIYVVAPNTWSRTITSARTSPARWRFPTALASWSVAGPTT